MHSTLVEKLQNHASEQFLFPKCSQQWTKILFVGHYLLVLTCHGEDFWAWNFVWNALCSWVLKWLHPLLIVLLLGAMAVLFVTYVYAAHNLCFVLKNERHQFCDAALCDKILQFSSCTPSLCRHVARFPDNISSKALSENLLIKSNLFCKIWSLYSYDKNSVESLVFNILLAIK